MISSSPSICAFTVGNRRKASVIALVKKLMKPRPTPCVSLNLSLYLSRNAITALMSTSLKVVSMAVSFFTLTSRSAIFLRNVLILFRLLSRDPPQPFIRLDPVSMPPAT